MFRFFFKHLKTKLYLAILGLVALQAYNKLKETPLCCNNETYPLKCRIWFSPPRWNTLQSRLPDYSVVISSNVGWLCHFRVKKQCGQSCLKATTAPHLRRCTMQCLSHTGQFSKISLRALSDTMYSASSNSEGDSMSLFKENGIMLNALNNHIK